MGKPPPEGKKQDLTHIRAEEVDEDTKKKYPKFYSTPEVWITVWEYYPTFSVPKNNIPPHLHNIFCRDKNTPAVEEKPANSPTNVDLDEAFLPSTTPTNFSPALTRQQKKKTHRHN